VCEIKTEKKVYNQTTAFHSIRNILRCK